MGQMVGQGQAISGAAYVPPGWYPDPFTGQGERYWDGIAWSREFARSGSPQYGAPIGQPAQPQPVSAIQVSEASPTSGSGVIAMVAALALFAWRVGYMADYWQLSGTPSAYGQGVLVGSFVGFFLTGLLFTWGLGRLNAAREGLTGEAARTTVGEATPMALGIAVGGIALSYVLGM